MTRFFRSLFSLLALLLLAGCSSAPVADRPMLATSIEPLRYLVEQLAGDHYEVRSLTPEGMSPETYEPTPQQLVELSHAEAYFAIGTLGFEQTQLKKIVEETPSLEIYNLTDSLELLPSAHTHTDGTIHTTATDLHVWTSPRRMKQMAAQVCEVLCRLDTTAAPYYKERLSRFSARADSLDEAVRTLLKPVSSRTFVIYHPALAYFAHDYGLTQLAIEDNGKEPTPQTFAALVAACRAQRVKTLFVQEEYSGKMAERLAHELRIPVQRINPLSYAWDKELLRIARSFQ